MNSILQNSMMPDSWIDANITVISKEGQNLNLTKYIYISLLYYDFKRFTMILAERLKIIL